MKKFVIAIGQVTSQVNANEYNVAPKTGEFKASVMGQESSAFTTSGKGKSAVNNHYIYFKDNGKLYYFKSNAADVARVRADGLTVSQDEASLTQEPAATPAEPKKARRQRSKA